MSDPAHTPPAEPDPPPSMSLVSPGAAEPYRRLVEIFHDVLSEESPTALLERIADTLAELVPYEDVHIYEADEGKRELIPVLARSKWETEVMSETFSFGQGITGWAVEHREPVLANRAHLDPRVRFVPGTPVEPEALIAVPSSRAAGSRGRSTSTGSARTPPSRTRSSTSLRASATRRHSRSTTPTFGRASSIRPRPTR
jgi:hypothetical protein